MNVTLNGINRNGMYLFDGIPNIVEFSSLGYSASGAQLTVTLFEVTPTEGLYLTINGETITSVVSQSEAGPRQFGTNCTAEGLANNISRALSSIPSLASSYDMTFNSRGEVIIRALGNGLSTAITYDSDIPLVEFTYIQPTETNSPSYVELNVSRNNPSVSANMNKSVVSDNVRFDISGILGSMTDEGTAVPVSVSTSVVDSEGNVTRMTTFNEYVVNGWHDKGHEDYIVSTPFIAQNLKGAPARDVYNNTVLYALQGSDVGISWCSNVSDTLSVSYAVYDSAFTTISSGTVSRAFSQQEIGEFIIPSSATTSPYAWYLSVTMPDDSVVRYNLIRSVMSSSCLRVYWRNSMGGISFFDFTGEMSEKTEISSEYMYDEGSSYGYYADEYRHDALLYSQEAVKTYTVQSHIIEEAGCPILDDLASSKLVWTERDGRKYMLLVTAVEKVKVSSNGTYRIKLTYNYSVNE